ncbi:MAG: hypothetical protein EXR87_04035 [Gammaproteobacteria bacterium]|nr:hypothetical protein [Gammaproteobacteria bacterium]
MDKSELLSQLRIDRGADAEVSPPRTRLWIALAAFALVAAALLAWLLGRGEATRVTVATAHALPTIGGSASVLRATRQPVTTALRAA